MAPSEKDCVTEELCKRTHADLDRRLTAVETTLKDNLSSISNKLEHQTLIWAQKASDNAKRPGWPTLIIITFLSSLSVALLVARAAGH